MYIDWFIDIASTYKVLTSIIPLASFSSFLSLLELREQGLQVYLPRFLINQLRQELSWKFYEEKQFIAKFLTFILKNGWTRSES